jgi:hypothetical protein
MKKLVGSYSISLPPLKLFVDDIDEIIHIISEISENIQIRSENYELDNASDLLNLDVDTINHLEVESNNPYISAEFSRSGARLYISTDDASSRGILEKIRQICFKRRRRFASFVVKIWPSYVFVFIGVILMGISEINRVYFPLGLLAFLVYIFLAIANYIVDLRRYSIIVISKSTEHPNFLMRNSDEIIIGVGSAIIGGLIVLAITMLVNP